MKHILTRANTLRFLLAAGALVLLLLLVPRADRQSFSYELNQPWKYPLLTAEFDTPILRDSASARMMRDSIDATFIPFVKQDSTLGKKMARLFRNHVANSAPAAETNIIAQLIEETYNRGILEPRLYNSIQNLSPSRVRISENANDDMSVVTVDASAMLSPIKAFQLIDSLYSIRRSGRNEPARLSKEMASTLGSVLIPNIDTDSAADNKFRSQEYLAVAGALGVIKKGQRIVDRGEIITPQIFTNLNTYQEVLEKNDQNANSVSLFVIGQAAYLAILIILLYLFLALYRPTIFASLSRLTFIVSFIVLFVVFAIEMFRYVHWGLYMVPFAAVPVVIMVFTDTRTAVFSLFITVLATALVASFPLQFIFTEISVGLAATFSLHQLTRRSQLLRTALLTFFVYILCYAAVTLVENGSLQPMTWRLISVYAINAVLLSFAYILILVFEKIFGFTSLVTLVELSDINTPILRKMAEVAPGTFQHSIQVSTLASEAARAIGADSLLTRAGALYHDIGKTESPIFFTENQHGVNPHAGLDPVTSAQKIISHVTQGVAIANKEKLPALIRNFITEHHGRALTKFFYTTAVNNAAEGETVDAEKFRYPGPDPRSKETSILMMADCVEAASRSLKEYTQENIDNLVDKLIDGIVADGRLKDSPISLHDIEVIKNTFKKRLATIYHTRIAYPELKN